MVLLPLQRSHRTQAWRANPVLIQFAVAAAWKESPIILSNVLSRLTVHRIWSSWQLLQQWKWIRKERQWVPRSPAAFRSIPHCNVCNVGTALTFHRHPSTGNWKTEKQLSDYVFSDGYNLCTPLSYSDLTYITRGILAEIRALLTSPLFATICIRLIAPCFPRLSVRRWQFEGAISVAACCWECSITVLCVWAVSAGVCSSDYSCTGLRSLSTPFRFCSSTTHELFIGYATMSLSSSLSAPCFVEHVSESPFSGPHLCCGQWYPYCLTYPSSFKEGSRTQTIGNTNYPTAHFGKALAIATISETYNQWTNTGWWGSHQLLEGHNR